MNNFNLIDTLNSEGSICMFYDYDVSYNPFLFLELLLLHAVVNHTLTTD